MGTTKDGIWIDWPFIQALYLKGLTPKQIKQETGVSPTTLRQRANRYKWKAKRDEMAQIPNHILAEVHKDFKDRSKATREALGSVMVTLTDSLSAIKATSPSKAYEHSQGIESIVRNCEKVFGWNDQNTKEPPIRINILGNTVISPAQLPEQPAPPAQIIDIPKE